MKRHIIIVGLLLAGTLHAQTPGESAATAILIPTGTNGLVGNLIMDTDVVWYRFLAAPTLVYTVQVQNVSLWDNALAVRAFAESETMASTNSAWASSAGSTLMWTNTGGVRHYYLAVSALLQFATGTYRVVVSANDADTDGDGLPDAWETHYFGGPTNATASALNASGVANDISFMTGTDPNNLAGALRVTALLPGPPGPTVYWPTVPYAAYRIESCPNLFGDLWAPRAQINTGAAGGTEHFVDTPDTTGPRYYRVLYEVN